MAKIKTIEKITIGISIAALALSAATAWFQFRPVNDAIVVAKNSRSGFFDRVEITENGLPIYGKFGKYDNINPVSWDIILYNPTGKTESIVGARVFYVSTGGRIESSEMLQAFYPQPRNNDEQTFPFNINANSSRNFHVSLEIPILSLDPKFNCPTRGVYRTIEKCLQLNGRDIIGNNISRMDLGSENFAITWPNDALNPNFVLVLQTADGSKFEVPMEVFPFRELVEER